MTACDFTFCSEHLSAQASGALFWPAQETLVVSDLHLGRTERIARQGGHIIPPYENTDTLQRLEAEIRAHNPAKVICLGDSFDDLAATASLTDTETDWITRLQAGREWIWVQGNHDPAPLNLGGTNRDSLAIKSLKLRHIATPTAQGEISGHFHPKVTIPTRGRGISRPCFLFDAKRLILPAFGTYTGGLKVTREPLSTMFGRDAEVIITGKSARRFSLYSAASKRSKPAASRSG